MGIGVFDVATSGEDEARLQRQAMQDRLAAAVYDVRAKHGEWLFGAKDLDGFNDRAKLAFVSICETIEPHLHARTGVHRKVMKALEREWRERTACWPGCHENEAHAKKFHDNAKDDDKKESRRQAAGDRFGPGHNPIPQLLDIDNQKHSEPQPGMRPELPWPRQAEPPEGYRGKHREEARRRLADGPSVQQDPDRAHRVLDRTHEVADEHNQRHHQIVDHAHELVDQRAPQSPFPDIPGHFNELHDFGPSTPQSQEWVGTGGPLADEQLGDSIDDLMQSPLGQRFQEQGPSFGKPVPPPVDPRHFASYREISAMLRGAEFDTEHSHPELDTHETFEDHQGDTLKPAGDFDAYKDRVDQGSEAKVDHDFTAPDPKSSSPYTVERHDEDGDHNFVPTITGSREYQRIAAMIHADLSAPPGAPGMGGSGAPQGATAPNGVMQTPSTAPVDTSVTAPAGAGAGATPVDPAGAGNPAANPAAMGVTARKWALRQIREVGTKEARLRLLAVARSHGAVTDKEAARVHTLLTTKVAADSNYLQKADEALTKVLNQKAEEFQATIAPLQQALITIQQAEQMSNPLAVSPPAGTVNVLPGQQQASGAGAAMGASGGGVGLGASPAAAGLAGQPATQAMQQTARKRGGRGKGQRG